MDSERKLLRPSTHLTNQPTKYLNSRPKTNPSLEVHVGDGQRTFQLGLHIDRRDQFATPDFRGSAPDLAVLASKEDRWVAILRTSPSSSDVTPLPPPPPATAPRHHPWQLCGPPVIRNFGPRPVHVLYMYVEVFRSPKEATVGYGSRG